jgi:putative ABC transport system substrate-binding protein
MKRRESLLALASALAIPGELFAQSTDRARRVHLLWAGMPEDSEAARKAIAEGLRSHGWIENQNLLFEVRYTRGRQEALSKLAEEIVRAAPDVIIAAGPASAIALKNTGTTIPVVFVVVYDPVQLGLAKSLARPGGTFTGLSTAVPGGGFFGKQIQLLREAVPGLKRIALLLNPRNPIKGAAAQAVQNANLMTGQPETAGLAGLPLWP